MRVTNLMRALLPRVLRRDAFRRRRGIGRSAASRAAHGSGQERATPQPTQEMRRRARTGRDAA